MAAARYWRLIGAETYGFQADLELSEFALYEAGVRVDTSATISASHSPSSGSLANIADADGSTFAKWIASIVEQPGFYIQWDFGVGVTKFVDEFRIGGVAEDTFLYGFIVQSSADAVSWETEAYSKGFEYGGSGVYAIAYTVEPNWQADTLLLRGDGTVIVDGSPSPKSIELVGSTQVSATQSKFGGKSIRFNGSTDYLNATPSSSIIVTTSHVTIDCWVYTDANHEGAIYSNFSGGAASETLLYNTAPGSLTWYYDGNANNLQTAVGVLPEDQWNHIALVKQQGSPATFKIFINGIERASTIATQATFGTSTLPVRVGDALWTSTRKFNGYIDEFRVTLGVARWTSNFTPPTRPGGVYFLNTVFRGAPVAPATAMLGFDIPGASPTLGNVFTGMIADQEDFGFYQIVGTVKVKSIPDNVPLRRRVRLHRELDGRLIRETWSDAVTGEYSFANIRGDSKYTIISFDYTTSYRAVIADNVSPELMP